MECGQVREADSICSIFITGIFRNCLQEGELGKVRFQAGKLGHTPKLMPKFIMFIFKAEEYWGGCQGQV